MILMGTKDFLLMFNLQYREWPVGIDCNFPNYMWSDLTSQVFLDVTHIKSYMIINSECQSEQLICVLRSCSVYSCQPHTRIFFSSDGQKKSSAARQKSWILFNKDSQQDAWLKCPLSLPAEEQDTSSFTSHWCLSPLTKHIVLVCNSTIKNLGLGPIMASGFNWWPCWCACSQTDICFITTSFLWLITFVSSGNFPVVAV